MLIDMHIHTRHSACSVLEPLEVVECGRELGLDGVCITDHNTMDVLEEVPAGVQADGFVVLVGMEYTVHDGSHYLVFGPVRDIPLRLSPRELVRYVTMRGGVAFPAHPFRPGCTFSGELFGTGDVPCLEAVNGRNLAHWNSMALHAARRQNVAMTGGSDAHMPCELARVATRFENRVESVEQLVAELRAGRMSPAILPRGRECFTDLELPSFLFES